MLSATSEGEHTADRVRELLMPYRDHLKVSELGRGLATGSELEYSDAETLPRCPNQPQRDLICIVIVFLTFVASALALFAEGKYIVSIVRGKTKPNFSGWLIFTVSMVCVLVSAYTLGARDSLILIATFTGTYISS